MKIFLGIVLGLMLAVGIAAGAGYMAFGDLKDFGDRDKTADISRTYELTDFDEIEVGGVYELTVQAGSDFSIKVSGHPDQMDRAEVSVENGILTLSHGDENRGKRNWRTKSLSAEITLPSLSSIDVAGVAEVDVSGIEVEDFSARLSGVGEIELSGNCGDLSARVSGVGELDASSLRCATVDVTVSGIGEAEVYASEAVDASVGGIGSITVYGSPSQVEKSGGFLSDITVK